MQLLLIKSVKYWIISVKIYFFCKDTTKIQRHRGLYLYKRKRDSVPSTLFIQVLWTLKLLRFYIKILHYIFKNLTCKECFFLINLTAVFFCLPHPSASVSVLLKGWDYFLEEFTHLKNKQVYQSLGRTDSHLSNTQKPDGKKRREWSFSKHRVGRTRGIRNKFHQEVFGLEIIKKKSQFL